MNFTITVNAKDIDPNGLVMKRLVYRTILEICAATKSSKVDPYWICLRLADQGIELSEPAISKMLRNPAFPAQGIAVNDIMENGEDIFEITCREPRIASFIKGYAGDNWELDFDPIVIAWNPPSDA